jgi:site-specific recombinase XerD
MLKRAMQAAGFNSERLTAHSLRHTAGTAVQEITGDIYQTQKYMRHSNPATTEIYLHNETEQAEAGIAQQLYNLYHQTEQRADNAAQLEQLIALLNPQKLEQLTRIAAQMA